MTASHNVLACLVLAQHARGVEVLAFTLTPGEHPRAKVAQSMKERRLRLQSFEVVRQVGAADLAAAEEEVRRLVEWFGQPDNRAQVLARYTRPG